MLTWGKNGHGDGEFDIPIAVAVNQKDEILVTDFRQSNADAKSRVQRFDQEGRFWEPSRPTPCPAVGLGQRWPALCHAYDEAQSCRLRSGRQTCPRIWQARHAPASLTSLAVSPSAEMDRFMSRIRRTNECSDYTPGEPITPGANTAWRRANSAATRHRKGVVAGRTFWPSTARVISTLPRRPSVECRSSTPTVRSCSPGEITKWAGPFRWPQVHAGPLAIAVDDKDQVG